MKRIGLIWRTVRYLTVQQLMYQVLNRLRSQVQFRLAEQGITGHFLSVPNANKLVSRVGETFTFLNQSVQMTVVDWNYGNHGKLWTYNLNYFDFLNQSGPNARNGLLLIRDFISQTNSLKDGLEAYPTSLRIINWVQFLSRNQIQDDVINQHLYAQTRLLRRRIEYHIAGNHLLENGFALLTAALYFRHNAWFRRATKLVRTELSTQMLADGGHDERSPMYHQLLLDRLLDVLLAVKHNTWHNDPALSSFLEGKATQMLGWLDAITFRNGDVQMVNDAASGIAPTTEQLWAKAVRVGLVGSPWSVKTQPTGYRKFSFPRYELVADVGPIGPDHQPGHGHADTFSFVLYVDNQPLIVDSGTSTYDIGTRRAWERSTAAHNTVDVMGINSSEVWGGFRVGRRARVTVVADTQTTLMARHDGYCHMGIIHERTWSIGPMHICITDRLIDKKTKKTRSQSGVARLYFHPDVAVSLVETGLEAGAVRISFASESAPELRLTTYDMADGFNQLRPAPCVEITFANQLETSLILTQ
ncbi:heparinase II/III domain-containing protein [Spirosoma arcticum]